MKARRLVLCPNCEKPSLMLLLNLGRTHNQQSEDLEKNRVHYLVEHQMCSCSSIASVVVTETEEDFVEEYEYTLAVNVIPSQPGSLGVGGPRYR